MSSPEKKAAKRAGKKYVKQRAAGEEAAADPSTEGAEGPSSAAVAPPQADAAEETAQPSPSAAEAVASEPRAAAPEAKTADKAAGATTDGPDAPVETAAAPAAPPPRARRSFRLKLAPDETKIDFIGLRRTALIGSAAAIVLSILALGVFQLNFGIDFRGGALVEARFEEPVDLGDLRQFLRGLDLGEIGVQEFGRPDTAQMRVEGKEGGDAQQEAAQAVAAALQQQYENVEIRRVEVVGPKVSGELVQRGVLAVTLAIAAVLVYIWLRFEWQFAVGAVAALVHDVVLTLGVFAIFGLEFTLAIIAAILTIVGYSLNDTVVVFDRVRENLRRFKTTPLGDVLNLSINETLSRTLMTSVTTLLALIALYTLGGPALAGFTFAMIWGVLVGTYSSVFIASPVLLWLDVKPAPDEPDETQAGVQFGG